MAKARRPLPKGLPPCARVRSGRGVTLCICLRCNVLRSRAVRQAGVYSDHTAALLTRAVAENA